MRRFDTLSSLLAPLLIACGGEPSPGETEAVGTGFHELVEPILQAHCQECHREGGGAPFPLLDYPGARARGAAMRDRTRDRSMPPWSAASTAMCQPRLGFHHDPTLSDAEITTLSEWVDRGMPEGDPANAPPPRVFPPPGLPGATHTIAPAAAYRVMAAEKDELRCFVLDPRLDGELLLDGATAVPGDPTLVHHISVFVDESRSVLERAPDGGSYDCPGGAGLTGPGHRLLLNWTPGGDRFELPEGTAMRIPAGAVLVLQIHYHPREDRDVDDRTEVQLRRARKKPSWLAEPRFLGNASGMEQPGSNVVLLPGDDDPPSGAAFLVPAGKSGHVETMRITLAATDEDGAPVPARPVRRGDGAHALAGRGPAGGRRARVARTGRARDGVPARHAPLRLRLAAHVRVRSVPRGASRPPARRSRHAALHIRQHGSERVPPPLAAGAAPE